MVLAALAPAPRAASAHPFRVPGAGSARRRRPLRVAAVLWRPAAAEEEADPVLTAERSGLISKEVVLHLFQLELDAQLQRALTYERFDQAQEIRRRRTQVDAALAELQELKGWGCGARRVPRDGGAMGHAPAILSLRAQMADAVAAEDYAAAAQLRDRLRPLEEAAEAAAAAAAAASCSSLGREPALSLGEMVVHTTKGYRGVVCGWDVSCCEGAEWQARAGVDALERGAAQPFYHVLVDTRDWPEDPDQPPVAYVPEERLTAGSAANFLAESPLVDGHFEHPFSYLLFLGADGQGNLLPCRQLRDKYAAPRRDVYAAGEERWEDDDGADGGGDAEGGGGGGPAGRRTLPGIDMRSLE
eukprot:scaffold2.g7314.t1